MIQPFHKKILTTFLLICIAGLCVQPALTIILKAWTNFRIAQAHQWDFDQIQRNYHFIFQVSHEAKQIIPANVKINVSFDHDSIEWIAARYSLYPHEITPEAGYTLIFPGQSPRPAAGTAPCQLSAGAVLFTPGTPPQKTYSDGNPTTTEHHSLFLMIFLTSLFLNSALGYLFLKILHLNVNEGGKIWFLGTSCLAGSALHSLSAWGLLLLSVPLNKEMLLGIWLSWFIILFLLNGLTQRTQDQNISQQNNPQKKEKKRLSFSFWVKMGVILLTLIIVILISLTPVSDWDGLSKWVLKAKVLFFKQSLDFHYTHQNYYPLLWPITIASQFILMGKVVDVAAQWLSAVYFLLCFIQIWGGLKILKISRQHGYYVLSVFLPLFFSYRIMATANAENFFLALTAAVVTAITAWLKNPDKKGYRRLACFCLAVLCLAKFEGTVTALIMLIGIIIIQKRAILLKDNLTFLICGLGSTLLPMLWIQWTHAHGYMNTIVHFQPDGLTQKIPYLIRENGYLFLLSPFCTLMVILRIFSKLHPNKRQWDPEEKWLLWTWAGLFLFSFFGNAGQSFSEIQHTGTDAFTRLFLHSAPSITLLTAARVFVRARNIE